MTPETITCDSIVFSIGFALSVTGALTECITEFVCGGRESEVVRLSRVPSRVEEEREKKDKKRDSLKVELGWMLHWLACLLPCIVTTKNNHNSVASAMGRQT